MPYTEMDKTGKELIGGGRGVRTWFGSCEHVKFGMAFRDDQLEE